MREKPDRGEFTPREWEVVERHRTPAAAQRYLTAMRYNREECGATLRSFRGVVRRGEAHCLEAALAAAAVLEQHGHPPLLMSLESQDKLDHVVFVFRRRGLWGAVARSRDLGLHGRLPVFRTLRALAWSYFDTYVDHTGRITGYGLGDLRELGGYDWRFSERNVWKVERFGCSEAAGDYCTVAGRSEPRRSVATAEPSSLTTPIMPWKWMSVPERTSSTSPALMPGFSTLKRTTVARPFSCSTVSKSKASASTTTVCEVFV
jgi:hypothetical protein